MTSNNVRRIVTGFDATGRSTIIEDGPATAVKTVPERPGYFSANLWRTSSTPADIFESSNIEEHVGVSPPNSGTVLRVIEIPPQPKDKKERERQARATFSNMFPDADQSHGQNIDPGMHQTDTVDYAIILEGEMFAVMEESETLMRAGDVLIQRGTNHAWANRSDKPCRVAFILIDGERN
jgi:mannose-6-phosphate isomerase-like protein (cupin superfamily)